MLTANCNSMRPVQKWLCLLPACFGPVAIRQECMRHWGYVPLFFCSSLFPQFVQKSSLGKVWVCLEKGNMNSIVDDHLPHQKWSLVCGISAIFGYLLPSCSHKKFCSLFVMCQSTWYPPIHNSVFDQQWQHPQIPWLCFNKPCIWDDLEGLLHFTTGISTGTTTITQCNHCIFPLSHFNPTTIVGQSRSYREKKLPMKNLQPQRKKIAYA